MLPVLRTKHCMSIHAGSFNVKSDDARTCSNHSDSKVKVTIASLYHMQQHSEFLHFARGVYAVNNCAARNKQRLFRSTAFTGLSVDAACLL
jgi:hypothetical protein